jgi:hypothetical protein
MTNTTLAATNQPAGVTFDFGASDFPGNVTPADDDKDLANDWTVSQPGGTTYRAQGSRLNMWADD